MTNQHPITPPPELVQQWQTDWHTSDNTDGNRFSHFLATRAAQWGADQELEACIDWISVYQGLEHPELLIELLRAARRPKPPSLKEQALSALDAVDSFGNEGDRDTIRRALEQLPDQS
jgi:hypothetical protein